MEPPRAEPRLVVEVVVPLRWDGSAEAAHTAALAEMTAYLSRLCGWADVTVVDGSGPDRWIGHYRAWCRFARVIRPDPGRCGLNGKVLGALAGIEVARHERVVLADDDVRYDRVTLGQVVDALGDADLVRPQNLFSRWPWHARWDGSRSLLNRALGSDWPGTFGLRRSVVLAMGGWDADVLFENLELVRTAQAAGARVVDAPRILVPRLPPTAAHFRAQRVRQAYDDLAQPPRLLAELAIVPLTMLGLRRRPGWVGAVAAAAVGVAGVGRLRGGASRMVPGDVPLWAPLWALERGVCIWLALGHRVRGGVAYHGRRLPTAAHSRRQLLRRAGGGPV